MKPRTASLCAIFLICAAANGPLRAQPAEPLLKSPGQDWLTYAGGYNSQRHSPLRQITPANVHGLAARWVYHVDGVVTLEASPIVANGVLFITGRNQTNALDARTGNLIWQAAGGAERGTAVYDGKVYVTRGARIAAVDVRNGSTVWEVPTDHDWRPAGGAPFVADGKVMITGNFPNGFIQAFDAGTGKHVWTWTPMPDRGDPAIKTWGTNGPKGAPIWVGGAYDPQQNLLFWGTGQPEPEFAGESRPGDNLYSDSVVALDADTGKLKWYFQNTPHDVHDWDSEEATVLVDTPFQGKPRKLLLQANRNGFYYVLDRTSGQFLLGKPFIDKIDWTMGLDAKGRPANVVPGHEPTILGTTTCPSTAGATNWPSPTFDPALRYFFVQATEGCGLNFRGSSEPDSDTGYLESPKDTEKWQLYVRAIDAFTGKRIWEYKEVGSNHYGPGLVSNAGGIVFAAEQMGQLSALDAKTGKSLWHFNTGAVITASPIIYGVGGRDYVAIAAGTNLFTFALPDSIPETAAKPGKTP